MTVTRNAPAVRIIGNPVPPLVPATGPVQVLLIGEAPGPRGADKSGAPFFGDAAGKHLYRVLRDMGVVRVPAVVEEMPWDGAAFAAAAIFPVATGVALGNAFDRCPTDDGVKFRTPAKRELESAGNIARLRNDIAALQHRGLRGIVTMGRVATMTMDVVCDTPSCATLTRRAVPHPSAQGLLSMAPNRGRGARMRDLQTEWMARCRQAILDAGYVSSASPEDRHDTV